MRTLTRFLLCSTLVAAAGGIVTSAASAAALPVITSVSPRSVQIGEKLTINGRNFRPGPLKTSVAFYRDGKQTVIIKAEKATSKRLTVTVSIKVLALFKDDQTTPRLIRLAVLTSRLGKKTNSLNSVTINPAIKAPPAGGGGGGDTTPTPGTPLTCEQLAAANGAGDEDKDQVGNATERFFGMNPCAADTDGDGVTDGFEFWSSVDLNFSYPDPEYGGACAQRGTANPGGDTNCVLTPTTFNGRRPFPNPLDKTDATKDFDGDGLLLWQEYSLWAKAGSPTTFNYSDGKQLTQVDPYDASLDLNGGGTLTDEERDFDKDKLSNYVEFNTTGTQDWWAKVKWSRPHGGAPEPELPYDRRTFADVQATELDTDGDGVADGDDDQDNDGWSNYIEMQGTRATTGYRIHPFNPCLPNLHAITCARYGLLSTKTFPPYDGDDATAPSVLPGLDYEIVRWPWNNGSPSYVSSLHPISSTIWDGYTGLQP